MRVSGLEPLNLQQCEFNSIRRLSSDPDEGEFFMQMLWLPGYSFRSTFCHIDLGRLTSRNVMPTQQSYKFSYASTRSYIEKDQL